jgi:hypothetical protein
VPTDVDDIKADAMIAVGQLASSSRYQRDFQTLKEIQQKYPPSSFDYYGVGHSLGGAILDLFLHSNLVKNGISYNPAVQPQDLRSQNTSNKRIYLEGDPLYQTMGKVLAVQPEVRKQKPVPWYQKLVSYVPWAGTAFNLYKAHTLDNFEGGVKTFAKSLAPASPEFAKQLAKAGIQPSAYLEEARRRAKAHGYPYKLLGFASNGSSKLAIPDENGRVVSFGKVGYGDHIIYSHLERGQSVPKGTADAKQRTFHRSHSKMRGNWRGNPFSANNLALKILW